jgi:catechol 2,3-dioxygenase-like lactoylglutathione lyase family enzyme
MLGEVNDAPALVPELLVKSLDSSLNFWCRFLRFEVLYDRPEEGFAYLTQGSAHVMLEQIGVGRNWLTGKLRHPLGRGINLQITLPAIDPILSSLREAGWALFREPETRWYRTGDVETGVAQFLVTDPDGYLLRFQSALGKRPIG